MTPAGTLTPEQRRALERLWFRYGNHGPKHTDAGHKFIQAMLEGGTDERAFFGPPADLVTEVDAVLDLPKSVVCPMCRARIMPLKTGSLRKHGKPCPASNLPPADAAAMAARREAAGAAWYTAEQEVGRLFDLHGDGLKDTPEGQAAVVLEQSLWRAFVAAKEGK